MVSMLLRRLSAACGLGLVLAAGPLQAAAPEETNHLLSAIPVYAISTARTGSAVNWAAGQLEVVGQGYALGTGEAARLQARATAYTIMLREARRAVGAVLVDGDTAVSAVLQREDARALLDQLIANVMIIDERWDEKAKVYTAVCVLPLYGQRSVAALGSLAMGTPKPVDLAPEDITITMPVPRGHTPQRFAEPYSGIIVNGDAALLTPCLFPSVLRFDGKELWGPSALPAAALFGGPVRYAANLQAALDQGLAGRNPLIVEAVGHGFVCCPVLNLDDVYLVLVQNKQAQLLAQLPIIITLGQQ